MEPGQLLAEGIQQFERWQAERRPADLDAAIASFGQLGEAESANAELRYLADVIGAAALGDRYQLSDAVADIDAVIERLRRVVACADPPAAFGPQEVDAYHVALGRALSNRIEMYGQPGGPAPIGDAEFLRELETAIDALAVAATTRSALVTPVERTEAAMLRARLVPKLVLTRDIVGRKAGRLADIPELERVLRELPDDHPNRAQLILELGLAHMHLVLRPGRGRPAIATSEHRVPAVRYLSQAVELLEPGYLERPKAIAYLSYLSMTRRPNSPDAAAGVVVGTAAGTAGELAARGLDEPRLDPVMGTVLRLLAGMTAGPRSAPKDQAAAVAQLTQALSAARRLGGTAASPGWLKALPPAIAGAFRGLLSNPQASSPSLADQDAADAQGRELLEHLSDNGLLDEVVAAMPGLEPMAQLLAPPMRRGLELSDRLTACRLDGNLAGLDAALAELEQQLAELPPDHEFGWMLLARVGAGWQARGTLSGLPADTIRGLRTQVTAMDLAAERTAVTQLVDGAEWTARLRAASAAAQLGRVTRDPHALTAAIRRLSELDRSDDLTPPGRADVARLHGATLLWRHNLTHDRVDLNRAIAKFLEASRLAGEDADYDLLYALSLAYWTRRARGDREEARTVGLRALRQRAAGILVQGDAEQGLRAARAHQSGVVPQLVTWCLAEDRPDQAIEALELGRALVLHAATVMTDVPGQLRLAGQGSLADQWLTETGDNRARAGELFPPIEPDILDPSGPLSDPPPLRIPSLLRRSVLDALRGTPAGTQLLAVPGLDDLSGALRAAGADAFAYLIPPTPAVGDGFALLVHADGGTERVLLPGLSSAGALDAYDAAFQAATETGWEAADTRRAWQDAVRDLCAWAWEAGTGPVLQSLARRLPGQRDRVPRVVIIPAGRLGAVPWHAASTAGADGCPHYAIEDAVFSYAASAGQFVRAIRRSPRPWSAAPLLLSDPTDELPAAQLEAAELHRRYYPDAVFLGQPSDLADGKGTPQEVLSRLPGGDAAPASLVHCACHANVASSLAESHLLLAEERPLPIAAILAQAEGHDPGSPGFLAVLSACLTDLAHVDQDEALTLASSLLALGASAVIGARWPADDLCTVPLMMMFHHFLNNGHNDPAAALRAAQLWMLDSGRQPLDDLPPDLAGRFRLGSFLAAPHVWAAFTCHGGAAG